MLACQSEGVVRAYSYAQFRSCVPRTIGSRSSSLAHHSTAGVTAARFHALCVACEIFRHPILSGRLLGETATVSLGTAHFFGRNNAICVALLDFVIEPDMSWRYYPTSSHNG